MANFPRKYVYPIVTGVNCITELDKDCKQGEGITNVPDIPKT
ncbi:MAG: hypothetical protein ABIB97_00625 [Patescibacteria group bacterium]